MILDRNTVSNLELIEPYDISLFSVLNRCRTAMGKRMLKEWILSPLKDIDLISKRADAIEELVSDGAFRARMGHLLSSCGDMEKAISRLTLKMGAPNDRLTVRETLKALPDLVYMMSGRKKLSVWTEGIDLLEDLTSLLASALSDSVPRFVRDGGIIRDGYDAALDEWRDKAAHSSAWLERFEEEERQRTGIKNLKPSQQGLRLLHRDPESGLDRDPAEYTETDAFERRALHYRELKIFEKEMSERRRQMLAIEER
jgi:DNA mismatch repair protein MutS